jgi:hypothetical protein
MAENADSGESAFAAPVCPCLPPAKLTVKLADPVVQVAQSPCHLTHPVHDGPLLCPGSAKWPKPF